MSALCALKCSMGTLLVTFLFLGSLGGIIFILRKRLGELKALPENREFGIAELAGELRHRVQQSAVGQSYAPEKLLHRILSKIRVFILRIERQVALRLENLRKRSKARTNNNNGEKPQDSFDDNYWEQLKKK